MEEKVILITGASGGMGTHLMNWFKKATCEVSLALFRTENS